MAFFAPRWAVSVRRAARRSGALITRSVFAPRSAGAGLRVGQRGSESAAAAKLALHAARDLLRLFFGVCFALYGAWSAARRRRPSLPLPPDEVQRILVVRLDLLGDAVFSLPAIEALHSAYPRAHLDVLALPYTAPIFARCPAVRGVYQIDVNRYRRPFGPGDLRRLLAVVGAIRRARYDLAVGLSGLAGGAFAALSGARWRVGYRRESFRGCYNLPLRGQRYELPSHEVDYCLAVVRALGLDAPSLAPKLARAGGDRTCRAQAHRDPEYAVLVPGASNGAAKRWPAPYWTLLADRLADELGLQPVLSGSAGERALCEGVADAMRAPARVSAGETDVEGLIDLLAGARVVVAGDTGPLHVAAALGVPCVGIYGPTDPTNTGPLAPASRALRLGLACSPCYDLVSPADCKLADRSAACMWGVGPSEVLRAVREALST